MKVIIFVASLMSCNPTPQKLNTDTAISPVIIKPNVEKQDKKDTITFKEFEKLIKDEESIPVEAFKKFVSLADSALYSKGVGFIGKGIVYKKNFKIIHIKQGDKNNGNSIFLSYDNSNKQTDSKIYLAYCNPCINEVLISNAYLSYNKDGHFIVEYYKPIASKEMPDLDNIKVLRKERWTTNSKGFFIPYN